jgi:AcrR family transcriptional regulator
VPKLEAKSEAKSEPQSKPKSRRKRSTKSAVAESGSRRDDARARMYHDLIFESAEFVLGEKGFDHATMQDIASEAGISLKTLYTHFAGKQEIYEEVQRVRGAAFVDYVLAATAVEADPEERLSLWARAYVDFLFAHRDWLHVHLQIRTSWGLRPTEDYAERYWQQGLDGVGGILASGIQTGVFHEAHIDRMAAVVLAIMQVQVAQAVEAKESAADEIADEIMVQLRRLLCVRQASRA